MRRRDGTIPPKKTYSEIMEDLNNASEEFKQTLFYKRLVMKAEMIIESTELGNKNNSMANSTIK